MEGGRNEENPVQRERPPEVAAEQHQPPQPQKCPRCDSFNTKFCYYNNYSLSQPRYFCKACRRYWTQGGTLRNVPIGGSCRKSKRPRTTSSNNLVARATHGLPPTIRAQSFTGILGSDQRLVAAQPVNSSLLTGGSFLSSLAAMHSLPGNQGAAPVNLCGGGNMTLLQGISLPPDLKSPTTSYQLRPPSTHYFPPYWSQALINTGSAASSSAAATTSSFWSCNDQTDSSFTPNTHPGFNPSQ